MQKTYLHYFPVLIGSLLLASGCASLGDYHYECTQKLRARTEYRGAGHPECSKYPRDYKKGWIDGFYEVSTGGSLCPPAIAPECYWKPGQILNDCDNRRHEYYSGWQDGAARASQFPDTHYLKIYETCECPFPRCECGACGPGGGACVSVHGPVADCSCGGAGTCDACNPAGMVFHRGVIESDREIIMMPIPDSSSDKRDPSAETTPPASENEDPLPAAVAAPTSTEPPAHAQPEPPAISPPEVDVSLGDPNATEEPVQAESIEQPIEPRSAATITAEDVREADEAEAAEAVSEEAEIEPPLPPAIPAVEAETPQPVQDQKPESPVSLTAPALNTPVARYSFPDDNSQTIEFDNSASSLPRAKQVTSASIKRASAKRTAKAKAASSILSDFDIRFDHDGLID